MSDRLAALWRRVSPAAARAREAKLAHMRERLARAASRYADLRGRLDQLRGATALQDTAAHDLIAGLLRHHASARVPGDADPDTAAAWASRSVTYAVARAQWAREGGSRPEGGRQQRIDGLTWAIPDDRTDPGSLSHRMLHRQWLPIDDIGEVRPFAAGGVMLDIGANIGTTSIPRIVLGDFARVCAAEPDSVNFACLVENVLANGLGGLVLPDRVAISSAVGTARLRRASGMGGHHLLVDGSAAEAMEDVEVLTVERWLERLQVAPGDVRFVKVDTQGWELQVLLGALPLLAGRRAAWQIEVSPAMLKRARSRPEDLIALVATHFTHVRELGRPGAPPWRPTGDLPEVLSRVEEQGRFGNLLLFNLA